MKGDQPVDNHLLKIPLFHDAHMHFMVNGYQAKPDDYSLLSPGISFQGNPFSGRDGAQKRSRVGN